MKKPMFEWGDRVIPTLKAFENGVSDWNRRSSYQGLVLWCEGLSVRVAIRGKKKPVDFHTDF